MSPAPRYAEPFFWWGPGWATPPRRGIADLLRDGTLDAETAALLWAALARRRSLAVVAAPSGAGKSTLLAALLELLPSDILRVYLRGSYETFSFLTDPAIVPERMALIVNEISPHLPVYLWGPAVDRLLEATERGYAVLATAHADSVTAFVGMLTGSPLRIAAHRVAAFEFVALLAPDSGSPSGRRVRGVWRLRATRDGVRIEDCVPTQTSFQPAPPTPNATAEPWVSTSERAARVRILSDLRDGRLAGGSEWPSLTATALGIDRP